MGERIPQSFNVCKSLKLAPTFWNSLLLILWYYQLLVSHEQLLLLSFPVQILQILMFSGVLFWSVFFSHSKCTHWTSPSQLSFNFCDDAFQNYMCVLHFFPEFFICILSTRSHCSDTHLGDDSSSVCSQMISMYFSTTLSFLLSAHHFDDWHYSPNRKPGILT